ncbi:hypothetical protein TNCV_698641 [Trichonephila clavipes]|nr:hypothetical protein TNCV_698641 [Trichonephila clavipes]
MVRKKHKPIPEQRRAKKTSSTRRNSSDSAASEEPPEVTEMDIPLPASPHASRPGTPEKAGPTELHCKKLQGLARLIEVLSVSIETSQKILQEVISKGLTDPTNPIIQMESAALELNNSRHQRADMYPSQLAALKAERSNPMLSMQPPNHTAEHCNLTPKCLKCGDKHQNLTARSRSWTIPFWVSTARFTATWLITANAPLPKLAKCNFYPDDDNSPDYSSSLDHVTPPLHPINHQ